MTRLFLRFVRRFSRGLVHDRGAVKSDEAAIPAREHVDGQNAPLAIGSRKRFRMERGERKRCDEIPELAHRTPFVLPADLAGGDRASASQRSGDAFKIKIDWRHIPVHYLTPKPPPGVMQRLLLARPE